MPDPIQPNLALTEEQLRKIVHETVQQTVSETMLRLGVQVTDPIEMQKDFQHLRDWRKTTDSMKAKAMLAMVGLLVSGLAASAWMASRGPWASSKIPPPALPAVSFAVGALGLALIGGASFSAPNKKGRHLCRP